jgi:tetratricopeptide (TPR) repeat protein
MLAPFNRLSLVTVSPLLMLAIGCGDQGTTRTATVAASVTVDTTRSSPSAAPSPQPSPAASKTVAYSDGETAYQAGRYAEAAELFSAYTDRKPENPWGFYMLGLSSWKSGNLAQADVAFGEALKLDPKHQKSLLNSARVLVELGRTDEALGRAQAALALDSTSAESWRVLGRTQVELGHSDEAIDAYRRAITLDDHDVWAMNNLALIYIRQGCPTEALAPLARATQLKPGAPVFQNNLGQALEASGYPAAAQQAYQAALGADSTYQKAALALERVAGRGPDSTGTEVDLAVLARQFEASVEQWRDALAREGQAAENKQAAGAAAAGMARDSTPEVVSRPESEH